MTVYIALIFLSLLCSLLVIQLYGFWKLRAYHFSLSAEISSLDHTLNSLDHTLNMGIAHTEDTLRLYSELRLTRSLPAMRDWATRPDFLLGLTLHVKTELPRVIVECGSGVSTLVLARCAEMNGIGHVYSLEHLPDFADKTRQEIARHGLATYATVFTSPLIHHDINNEQWLWYSFQTLLLDTIDLFVIDGPPGDTGRLARYPAGPLLFNQLSPHAAVFLDDTYRSEEREILERWGLEFPEYHRQLIATQYGCAILRKETQEEVLSRCNARSVATAGR